MFTVTLIGRVWSLGGANTLGHLVCAAAAWAVTSHFKGHTNGAGQWDGFHG